jgi:hypothetical protein
MLLHDISGYYQSTWCRISADLNLKHVELLKTKRNLIYIRNQSIPRSITLSATVIKTNQLMLYKAKVAVSSEIRTKR